MWVWEHDNWPQLMFPVQPIIGEFTVGEYRNEAMQVQSGRYGKVKVHFIAPDTTRAEVTAQMGQFLNWLNTKTDHSGYIRAHW